MTRRRAFIWTVRLLVLGVALMVCGGVWLVVGASLILVGLVMPAFPTTTCGCCGTTSSTQIQVDVAGITNNTCVVCTDINGTYILDNNGDGFSRQCFFEDFDVDFPCIGNGGTEFIWDDNSSPGNEFIMATISHTIRYRSGVGSDPQDCSVSPGAINFTIASGTACIWAGSTATVTVL
jgi:hypothetical protein